MSDLNFALPTVLYHEGRSVNHAADPGGATDWGISLRFLYSTGDLNKDGWQDGDINHDGKINAEDIKDLTQEKAIELYRLYFWDKNGYDRISDPEVATKIFDCAVNMGSYAANKVAQRAVRSAVGIKLDEDGIMGLRTVTAINMAKPLILMAALKSEAAGYYRSIRYNGAKEFLTGWLNRAYSNPLKINEEN